MGALASNRKREPYPYSNPQDFQVSKRPRFSFPRYNNPTHSSASSNTTVARLALYPDVPIKLRREVHAPCRVLNFVVAAAASRLRTNTGDRSSSGREKSGEDVMGGSLSKRLDSARRSAFGSLRHLGPEAAMIEVDAENDKKPGTGKEIVSEDSSVEEVVVIEEDEEEEDRKGGKSTELDRSSRERGDDDDDDDDDDDVKIVEERSVVTVDGNLGEQAGKMLDSLVLNREKDVLTVEAYKKLLEDAARRSGRIEVINFEIDYNEKKLSAFQSLRIIGRKPADVVPREPFMPLTKEEEAEVERAFSSSNWSKILVSHQNSNIDITGEVLRCLLPGSWLNDEVINLYLELLKERERRESQKYLKCHFFNTFFYKKLSGGGRNGYDYRAVKRWTTEKKLGYFLIDCDKIFVPVHKDIHWCLAIINKKDRRFQYLDSLKGKDLRVLQNLAKYYVEEVKDKSKKDIDVSDWEQEFLEDLPEQENGYDCGMFMIKYADFYSRGLGLCFGQEHMPYFRQRTAKEILRLRAD